MDNTASDKPLLPEILLLLLGLGLLLVNVGLVDIDPYSEFFHLEAAKEAVANGRFWMPLLNGHDYWTRGPLWTWIVTVFFNLFGPSLHIARLPAIACAGLTLTGTYLLTMELTKNRISSLFASFVLLTTWSFFHGAGLSTAESLTTVLSVFFFWGLTLWRSLASRRNVFPTEINALSVGLGVLLGLLFLSEGTAAIFWVILVSGAYILKSQSLQALDKLNTPLFLAGALLVPLPWIVIGSAKLADPLFLWHYAVSTPFEKIWGLGLWQRLKGDWLFYLKRLPLDLLPYLFILPFAAYSGDNNPTFKGGQHPAGWTHWLLIWFAIGLIFNSLSAYQAPVFILPFMPPLAILAGHYLGQAAEATNGKLPPGYERALITVIMMLMLGGVLMTVIFFQVIPTDFVKGFWHLPGLPVIESLQIKDHVIPLPEALPIWKFWLIPGPFILLIGGFTLYLLYLGRKVTLTPIALVSTCFLFLVFFKVVYSPIMLRPVAQNIAAHINRHFNANDRLAMYGLSPDIKRTLFFTRAQFLSQIRVVRTPQSLQGLLQETQQVAPPVTSPTTSEAASQASLPASPQPISQTSAKGVLYGLAPEKSYFDTFSYFLRSQLRIQDYYWRWNRAGLRELYKLFWLRLPNFSSMRSGLIYFESIPLIPETPIQPVETKRRRRHR